MKLRIRQNSVRIRLTKSEVAQLARGEIVQQQTVFSPQEALLTSVSLSAVATTLTAAFDGRCVGIVLPREMALRWAHSDDVSLEAQQSVHGGELLRLLVEKDFECLHGHAEGIVDAYPNPRREGV